MKERYDVVLVLRTYRTMKAVPAKKKTKKKFSVEKHHDESTLYAEINIDNTNTSLSKC